MVETTNENFHNFHWARDIPTAWLAFRRTSQLRWTREFGALRRRFIFGAVLNALIRSQEHRQKGRKPRHSDRSLQIPTDPYRSLPFLSNGSGEKGCMDLETENVGCHFRQTFLADLFAADCGASFNVPRRTIQNL
jgi:hypothetical protein